MRIKVSKSENTSRNAQTADGYIRILDDFLYSVLY